jgi:hypothetical protein
VKALLSLGVSGVLAFHLSGCDGRRMEARIDGALLPETDGTGVDPAPAGPTLVVRLETDEATLAVPAGPNVRLAIDRAVPWRRVEALIARVERAGAKPVLLVGDRHRVRAIALRDPLSGEAAIQMLATTTGKACVGPPDSSEMRCVQGLDEKHIHRAFVRGNVEDAIKAYKIREVVVAVQPEVEWADVVRALDGARTCCGRKRTPVALVTDASEPTQ